MPQSIAQFSPKGASAHNVAGEEPGARQADAARVATQTPVVYEKESEEQDGTVDEAEPTDSQPAGVTVTAGTNENEHSKPVESEDDKTSDLDDITKILISNEIR